MPNFRKIALFCPAEVVDEARIKVQEVAPNVAGLVAKLGINSGSTVTTHFGGLGSATDEEIEALKPLRSSHQITYAYIEEGPEGVNPYPTFGGFLGDFNLFELLEPQTGNGDEPPL